MTPGLENEILLTPFAGQELKKNRCLHKQKMIYAWELGILSNTLLAVEVMLTMATGGMVR